jgi:hypothetical protein
LFSFSEIKLRAMIVYVYGILNTHGKECFLWQDDPVCEIARNNGKFLVTEIWISDCLELGVIADANHVSDFSDTFIMTRWPFLCSKKV